MSLTKSQEIAMKTLVNRHEHKEPVSILQGIAGSGKSYLLSYLIDYLGYNDSEVAFATYTGTAAKLLMKQGLNASTLHKLIYNPIMRRGICVGFSKKSMEDLRGLQLIIIDEFSMVPKNMMDDLFTFNIPIILVGDHAQLPPIGEPNQFVNQYHALLDEPIRQALENPIFWAANEVRLGKRIPNGLHGDILFIGGKSNLDNSWLRHDVKILAGLNKTRHKINTQIAGSATPMTGHKIIFLKNDWKQFITNGTIAETTRLKQVNWHTYKITGVLDDDRRIEEYVAGFQKQSNPRQQFFDFAFCLTTHKAQGATYDAPGLIIDESSFFRENRDRWLYTAITRFTGNHNVAILK